MAATDTSIAVTIKAAIDASFASAMADAAAEIDRLADAAAGASKKSKSGSAGTSGDATVKLEQRAQELRIQGAARANQQLFSLGQESAAQMVAQAQSLEDQRYQIEIEGAANKMAADAKSKSAEAKDSAEAEVLLQEHLNRQAEINQRYAEDQKKLSTEATRDYVQSQQQQLAAGLASYSEQYKAGTISAAQREEADKDLLDTTQRNIDDALQTEIGRYTQGTEAYSNAQNEKAQIDQEFAQKHKALIAQSAQDEIEQWRGVVSAVTSAEGELVNDIFTKRQSLQRDLAQIGERMVEQEVANDIKAFTEKEIYNALGVASDKSTAQEGLLFKLGTYLLDKTGLISSEAAKTGAVEAGTAVRTTLQDAGMAKGLSNVIKSATQVIAADAGQAAGGAQASASQIPYIGWLIGPAAAAEAFSAVMGFASFAVGTNYVPHDMIAQVHAGERIVPRADNVALMDAIRGGGSSGGTHYNINITHSPSINAPQNSDLHQLVRAQPGALVSAIQGLVRGGYLKLA